MQSSCLMLAWMLPWMLWLLLALVLQDKGVWLSIQLFLLEVQGHGNAFCLFDLIMFHSFLFFLVSSHLLSSLHLNSRSYMPIFFFEVWMLLEHVPLNLVVSLVRNYLSLPTTLRYFLVYPLQLVVIVTHSLSICNLYISSHLTVGSDFVFTLMLIQCCIRAKFVNMWSVGFLLCLLGFPY